MIFREMTVEDLDQVLELEKEIFSPPWSREGFFTYLMRDEGMFFVVEEKEKILGYIGMIGVLDEGDITNVAVDPNRRREGIGTFLVRSLMHIAQERGIRTIHLEVRQSNHQAIRLYEREGFRADGLRKNYYTDPVEDAILMSCADRNCPSNV